MRLLSLVERLIALFIVESHPMVLKETQEIKLSRENVTFNKDVCSWTGFSKNNITTARDLLFLFVFFVAVCVFSPFFSSTSLFQTHSSTLSEWWGHVLIFLLKSTACFQSVPAHCPYTVYGNFQEMFYFEKKSYISWDISCLLHLFLNFPTHLFILI